MTAFGFINIVNQITYKPNWKIHAESWISNINIRFVFKTLDRDTEQPIEVVSSESLDERIFKNWDRKRVIVWIYARILKLEEHELNEWFKINGVRYIEPHEIG